MIGFHVRTLEITGYGTVRCPTDAIGEQFRCVKCHKRNRTFKRLFVQEIQKGPPEQIVPYNALKLLHIVMGDPNNDGYINTVAVQKFLLTKLFQAIGLATQHTLKIMKYL